VQEGTLGLLRALDRFDVASGGNFSAYASTTIHYAILDALPMEDTMQVGRDLFWRNRTDERVEALRVLQPLSLDAAHGRDEDCAFADVLAAPPLVLPETTGEKDERQRAKRAQVEALLARLTPREQQVLRLRYGLDEADGRAQSATAIARTLGLACSTVCKLEQRALQKLRSQMHPEGEEDQHLPDAQVQQEQRRQEQHHRLATACAVLAARGEAISVRALARLAHVDKAVIGPFLHQYWEQQGTEQERLEAACAELEAEGLPVTLACLCSRAHVGSQAAAAFLREYHPRKPKPPRPANKKAPRAAKASPQERLSSTFAQLAAQGEPITKARLRRLAGVSTDAAGAFLRAQRADSANALEPESEE
jgi:RNA polymerase sigma factor (sigma-70 family)